MSTQNIYDKYKQPTEYILNEYFRNASMELLKKKRFNFGEGTSILKMKEMLRLDKYVCNNAVTCYLSDDQVKAVREKIIKNSILKIDEL